ncbi:MAG: hypothetical protein ACRENH_03455 [Gemmatimonadaceae bacterium]
MKKITLLAAAALAAVAVGTSTLSAQDTTRKESKGEVKMAPTVASVVVVIDGSLATAGKVNAFKSEAMPMVEVVDVKPLITNEDEEKIFKTAFEKNKDSIKQLQEEIKKHGSIVKTISESPTKPEPGDVVGAELTADNRLVIYVWKK